MADKKITALTELASTAKAGEDFLHIIDYGGGSSPVNKRISLTNLFSKINLDTHIYGVSKTFEIGSTDSASSALKVTTGSNTTLTTSIQNEVVVNDDQSRHIDFTVKSAQSAGAIKVESDYTSGDSGPGIVFINSDAGNQGSGSGRGPYTCVYTATGSTANRKRFILASQTIAEDDVLTLGGANIQLASGTISDTVRGGTAQAASLVLSGLTAVTHTVLA